MIYIASDHAGFELKNQIVEYLNSKGLELEDLGPVKYDKEDDYPDLIFPCAQKVAENVGSRGIILGSSGQGEAIVANKVKGIRAVVFYGGDMEIIKRSRTHNNSQILSLGARYLTLEVAKEAVDLWLNTQFEGGRHERRIKKITELENKI
jgi:ribose 5-phosphate isomerase B